MDNDLISRAAAIAEIEEYIEEYSELEPETGYHNLKWCAMQEAKDALSKLPAVDVEPVRHEESVKPKKQHVYGGWCTWYYECGSCHRAIDYKDKFCRYCGKAVKWDEQ